MSKSLHRPPRLLIVVNTDWFFLSHRKRLAEGAHAAGFEVQVMTPDSGQAETIRRAGFKHTLLPLSRDGANPLSEVVALARLMRLYRQIRPDIVHHVTPKPVLYGSIAARFISGISVVNAVSGLGYVFSSDDRGASVLRPVVRRMYRLALNHPRSRSIFQNPDDRNQFEREGLLPQHRALLIRGSGVDCTVFRPTPEPQGRPVVMLPSRMLWDKGVAEFVEAARILQSDPAAPRFVLVGDPDQGNPTSVPESQIRGWVESGLVDWWGHRTDMQDVLAAANIVVLPSYREGLPKVLLEAAACGRAIVTSDVPGCREIVHEGINGLRVPAMDGPSLANGIRTLLHDPQRRKRFGIAGRNLAITEFAVESVVEKTLAVYQTLLNDRQVGANTQSAHPSLDAEVGSSGPPAEFTPDSI